MSDPIKARAGLRRSFSECLLPWFEAQPDRPIDPYRTKYGSLSFPRIMVPKADLETALMAARALKGDNKLGIKPLDTVRTAQLWALLRQGPEGFWVARDLCLQHGVPIPGRGFNMPEVVGMVRGIHDGSHSPWKTCPGLRVLEEGVRFYLCTGRDPSSRWSAVLDRFGDPIWEPDDGWIRSFAPGGEAVREHSKNWSKKYPKGWEPGTPPPDQED